MTPSNGYQSHHPLERRCSYQNQDSRLTLAEGLAEYYAANAGKVFRPNTLPEASAKLFRGHDVCHVIFGLDSTLADEAMADTRIILSCDVGARRYARYLMTNPEVQALFKKTGYFKVFLITFYVLPRILRAAYESWKMPKKWPWVPPPAFQVRTLSDLRREYGVRVI